MAFTTHTGWWWIVKISFASHFQKKYSAGVEFQIGGFFSVAGTCFHLAWLALLSVTLALLFRMWIPLVAASENFFIWFYASWLLTHLFSSLRLCFVSVNEAIWCKHHLNYNHIILPSLIKHQFSTAGFNVVAYFPNRNFYRTYGLITHYRKQFYNPHPKYIRVLTFTNYNFFLFLTLFCVSLCAPMYVWRSENNSQKPIFTRDPRMELMFIRLGSFPLRICYFYVYVCGSVHTNTGTEAKGIRFS